MRSGWVDEVVGALERKRAWSFREAGLCLGGRSALPAGGSPRAERPADLGAVDRALAETGWATSWTAAAAEGGWRERVGADTTAAEALASTSSPDELVAAETLPEAAARSES